MGQDSGAYVRSSGRSEKLHALNLEHGPVQPHVHRHGNILGGADRFTTTREPLALGQTRCACRTKCSFVTVFECAHGLFTLIPELVEMVKAILKVVDPKPVSAERFAVTTPAGAGPIREEAELHHDGLHVR